MKIKSLFCSMMSLTMLFTFSCSNKNNKDTSSESLSTESLSSEISSVTSSLEDKSSEESSSESPSVHIHTYSQGWIEDKAATSFEKGSHHRICDGCGETQYEEINYTLDFPRVYINYQDFYPTAPDAKDYNGFMNWTWEYLTVPIKYEGFSSDKSHDFECFAQMKIQGGTSKNADYLKKNYTIKLFEDRECTIKNKINVVDSWGAQSKYVLKANWIDVTSSRNLVTASIWSDVVESRKTSQYASLRDNVDLMVNNGAIDGFPIMLYFNNEYFGLYTFNIPKDNWLFGMKKSNTQALLFAEGTAKKANGSLYQSTGFKELIDWDNTSMAGSGWELEYAYDETNTSWVADSMNNAISLVMNTYGKLKDSMTIEEKQALKNRFITDAPNYLDIDGIIDYMIFLHCIQGFPDNSTKNVMWSTYDGKVWSPNAYDLDTTWNMSWDGQIGVFEKNVIDHRTGGFWIDGWYRANLRGNALFEAILLFYAEQAQNRFNELRKGPLSYDNISKKFSSFINGIPQELYDREASDYPTRPSEQISSVTGKKNTTNLNQILSFADNLLQFMDEEYNGSKMTHNINYFNS